MCVVLGSAQYQHRLGRKTGCHFGTSLGSLLHFFLVCGLPAHFRDDTKYAHAENSASNSPHNIENGIPGR